MTVTLNQWQGMEEKRSERCFDSSGSCSRCLNPNRVGGLDPERLIRNVITTTMAVVHGAKSSSSEGLLARLLRQKNAEALLQRHPVARVLVVRGEPSCIDTVGRTMRDGVPLGVGLGSSEIAKQNKLANKRQT